MKNIIIFFASIIAALFVACGSASPSSSSEEAFSSEGSSKSSSSTDKKSSNSSNAKAAGKTLILYFSWSNNTKTMAGYIHDEIGGDMEQIIPEVAYPEKYEDVADYAKAERDEDKRPKFKALEHNPMNYDTIFVGYPIWWYTLPMIIYTFFDTYDFAGKTVIPFNTHQGSSDGGTYDTIREWEPKATVLEGLPISGPDVEKESSRDAVKKWLDDMSEK